VSGFRVRLTPSQKRHAEWASTEEQVMSNAMRIVLGIAAVAVLGVYVEDT